MGKKKPLTPQKFEKKMNDILNEYANVSDLEDCHVKMDLLTCETLESLGYGNGIKLFRSKPKWYA